ncbi:MAG: DUF4430 domain-containing protein [Ruminococcus sp.]|nr:DUF4430 domain-containing protein [Ruminococcus sp.]
MQKKHKRNPFAFLLCMALIAAMPVTLAGCSEKAQDSSSASVSEGSEYEVLGEGETEFTFLVVDAEGNETGYEIHTDEAVVGDALQELELIAGDESEYGLYVKTVDGITLDYDTDGKYWAFYVDGEYAVSGVDTTDVTEGAVYSFKAE